MTDQTEKPKLGTRPPLGIKRTVETGKVKQSFSHGRSNTVVVEVKKRRILGKPGEPPPAEAPKPAPPRVLLVDCLLAHAQLIGLDDRGNERLEIRRADPIRHVVHRVVACLAESDLPQHAVDFLRERSG